jgi:hypothetical protein
MIEKSAIRPPLETPEDLFALIRTMPDQDRFNFLGIMNRLQKRKITVKQAMEEVKALLFKNGIFLEEPNHD